MGALSSEHLTPDKSNNPEQVKWGLMLDNLKPKTADRLGLKHDCGVVVAGVKSGSPADLAGIRRGDVILEVNQAPVDSVKAVKKHITKAEDNHTLLLLVNRNQRSFFVGLTG